MAIEKKPSIYSDRGNIGSAEELDEYGVWVKSEPQVLSAVSSNIQKSDDLSADFDDAASGSKETLGEEFSSEEISTFEDIGFPVDKTGSDKSESAGIKDSGLSIESGSFDTDFDDFEVPTVKSISNNIEKRIDNIQDDFDTSVQGKKEADLSTQLLLKIANELSSIRSELSELKKEFSIVRSSAPQGQEPEIAEEKHEQEHSGFFSEEEDETIALTGDELDNILNTADFTEESGADETPESDFPALSGDGGELSAETTDSGFSALPEEDGESSAKITDLEDIPITPADIDDVNIDMSQNSGGGETAESSPEIESAEFDESTVPEKAITDFDDFSDISSPDDDGNQETDAPLSDMELDEGLTSEEFAEDTPSKEVIPEEAAPEEEAEESLVPEKDEIVSETFDDNLIDIDADDLGIDLDPNTLLDEQTSTEIEDKTADETGEKAEDTAFTETEDSDTESDELDADILQPDFSDNLDVDISDTGIDAFDTDISDIDTSDTDVSDAEISGIDSFDTGIPEDVSEEDHAKNIAIDESKDSHELKQLREEGAMYITSAPENTSYLEEDENIDIHTDEAMDLSEAVIDEPELSTDGIDEPVTEPEIDIGSFEDFSIDDTDEQAKEQVSEDLDTDGISTEDDLKIDIPADDSVTVEQTEGDSLDISADDDFSISADDDFDIGIDDIPAEDDLKIDIPADDSIAVEQTEGDDLGIPADDSIAAEQTESDSLDISADDDFDIGIDDVLTEEDLDIPADDSIAAEPTEGDDLGISADDDLGIGIDDIPAEDDLKIDTPADDSVTAEQTEGDDLGISADDDLGIGIDDILMEDDLNIDIPADDSIAAEQTESDDLGISADDDLGIGIDDISTEEDLNIDIPEDDSIAAEQTEGDDLGISADDDLGIGIDDISTEEDLDIPEDDSIAAEQTEGDDLGISADDDLNTGIDNIISAENDLDIDIPADDSIIAEQTEDDQGGAVSEDTIEQVIPEGFEAEIEETPVPFDDDLEGDISVEGLDEALEIPEEEQADHFDAESTEIEKDGADLKADTGKGAPQKGPHAGGAKDGFEIPSELKTELRNILTYMDQLLESLPEEKIEEFAKSDYFDSYKKLFKELGLV